MDASSASSARCSSTVYCKKESTRPYETDETGQEYFKFSVFLVLSNRLLSCLMALGILAYSRGNVQPVAGIIQILRGQFIERDCDVLSIRSFKIRLFPGTNAREMREDDSR